MIRIVTQLSEVGRELPQPLEFWATSARKQPVSLSHQQARASLAEGEGSVVMLLGTAWGLPEVVLSEAARVLDPIPSVREDKYNHLSVRAAGAILLDRLLGARDEGPS
jgi:hypothetical protein